ncbi:MAG: hypothetical protein QOI61_488 [Actinomycetota bacterium]|jgi:hypothetical protein
MKRILLVAAGLMVAIGTFGAAPVFADDAGVDDNGSASWWLGRTVQAVDSAAKGITAPDGWHERSVCFGNMGTNQAWCLYFPWPI